VSSDIGLPLICEPDLGLMTLKGWAALIDDRRQGSRCDQQRINRDTSVRLFWRPTRNRLAPARYSLLGILLMIGLEAMGANEPLHDAASINAELSNIVHDTGLPGITFALFGRQGERSFAAGYADREMKSPMLPESVMMGASTGKMLVAVLAYQEVRLGRLHYSDKISQFFPRHSAYHQLPGAAQFTIAMLLRHSTGLVDGAVDVEAIRNPMGDWTNERRFKAARHTELLFPPGTAFSYSDLNYQILAAVIESIEGQYFGEVAIRRILEPLRMSRTAPATSQSVLNLASGYSGPTNKPQYENIKLPDKTASAGRLFMSPAFEGGGGGFSTDSPDMANFIHSLFRGALVGSAELDYMTSQPVPVSGRANDAAYAAGVFRYQTPSGTAFGHSGIWFGYKTMVLYYPSLCVGAAMQVNSQIDGEGNDLQVYQLNGRHLTMVDTLTELVTTELRSENTSTACEPGSVNP
jgi:D-alanyl-D-alanine carboxypeptidase